MFWAGNFSGQDAVVPGHFDDMAKIHWLSKLKKFPDRVLILGNFKFAKSKLKISQNQDELFESTRDSPTNRFLSSVTSRDGEEKLQHQFQKLQNVIIGLNTNQHQFGKTPI